MGNSMTPAFAGDSYDPALDGERLMGAMDFVRAALADGDWHTLGELEHRCGWRWMTQTLAGRIRDLRLPRWGGHRIERRRKPDCRIGGVWEYRIAAKEAAE